MGRAQEGRSSPLTVPISLAENCQPVMMSRATTPGQAYCFPSLEACAMHCEGGAVFILREERVKQDLTIPCFIRKSILLDVQ